MLTPGKHPYYTLQRIPIRYSIILANEWVCWENLDISMGHHNGKIETKGQEGLGRQGRVCFHPSSAVGQPQDPFPLLNQHPAYKEQNLESSLIQICEWKLSNTAYSKTKTKAHDPDPQGILQTWFQHQVANSHRMKGKKLKIHGAPIPTPTPLIPYQMDAYPNHTSELHGLQLQQIHQKTGGIKLPDGDFPKVQL